MDRIPALVLCLAPFLCVPSCRSVEQDTPPTHEQVSSVEQFLFVQNARAGSFDGRRLTLQDVPPTIFFSDRPYRVFGHTEPDDFVAAWKRGPNSFAEDPPNAILSLIGDGHVDSFMVSLSDPRYANGDFSYEVTVDHGTIPAMFEEASLFIDNNLWAAVGGFAAGRVLGRRAEKKQAAAYSANATAKQTGGYYYHAAPATVPPAPPPPPAPPQPSVSSLLSEAVAGMETWSKTASAANQAYVKQLISTLKAVEADFASVSK